mmetsp:Transcript_83250/g.257321  ORF Transcript_83250/g.257321 Transcript_83250/m.257321 type:complete len:233 (-) Transcript_83250:231-929(-)
MSIWSRRRPVLLALLLLAGPDGPCVGGAGLSRRYLMSSESVSCTLSVIQLSKTRRCASQNAAGDLLRAIIRTKSRSSSIWPREMTFFTAIWTCAFLILASARMAERSRGCCCCWRRGRRSCSAWIARKMSKASRTSRRLSTAEAVTAETGFSEMLGASLRFCRCPPRARPPLPLPPRPPRRPPLAARPLLAERLPSVAGARGSAEISLAAHSEKPPGVASSTVAWQWKAPKR